VIRTTGLIAATLLVVALVAAPIAAGAAALPRFRTSVATVTAAELGGTWHAGCPVAPSALRQLTVPYVGFDHRVHTGEIVVNVSVISAVTKVFATLYAARFPIRSLIPESHFDGKDPISMAADNSSGFNCRLAVSTGPPQWSEHAYGLAIDINPVENPYIVGGVVEPTAGKAFVNRAEVRPGMAVHGGVLCAAFASIGWYWGGRWTASPDYQHFSSNGG
jgi:hypothetical protein